MGAGGKKTWGGALLPRLRAGLRAAARELQISQTQEVESPKSAESWQLGSLEKLEEKQGRSFLV